MTEKELERRIEFATAAAAEIRRLQAENAALRAQLARVKEAGQPLLLRYKRAAGLMGLPVPSPLSETMHKEVDEYKVALADLPDVVRVEEAKP